MTESTEQVGNTPSPNNGPVPREESGFYDAYIYYARTLRTWFVAYGIGGPVILLTNETAAKAVLSHGAADRIAYTFLGGVAFQIISALLNKTAMWYLYIGEIKTKNRSALLHKAADWFSVQYWMELVFDLGTLVLFSWATLRVLRAVVP